MSAMHQLIVGGQRSGKSRHAELLAKQWLAGSTHRRVSLIATAQAGDEEMRLRIARHQADRLAGIETIEAPWHLSEVLAQQASPDRLLIIDCLTLWLTNWLMPVSGQANMAAWQIEKQAFLAALISTPATVVMVSNEVGWGVIPLGAEVRAFVDELGRLNQVVAQRCATLTLMVAGQAWTQPIAPMQTGDEA